METDPIVVLKGKSHGFYVHFRCQTCGEIIKDARQANVIFPWQENETKGDPVPFKIVHKDWKCDPKGATCWMDLIDFVKSLAKGVRMDIKKESDKTAI